MGTFSPSPAFFPRPQPTPDDIDRIGNEHVARLEMDEQPFPAALASAPTIAD